MDDSFSRFDGQPKESKISDRFSTDSVTARCRIGYLTMKKLRESRVLYQNKKAKEENICKKEVAILKAVGFLQRSARIYARAIRCHEWWKAKQLTQGVNNYSIADSMKKSCIKHSVRLIFGGLNHAIYLFGVESKKKEYI
ncbi:hypothetical protein NPIL_590011 [Nephila pilipes]|uniref:Uncharacterized protein n=1 Tax=Nephila pilipes TaxID=299642 RepID=A0A8X6P9Z1_NEPPI|nr:hypothetical protein NPIL_590011 [Nephila pilipes]